ncbi:hypothetical protein UA08_08266 [Talaromyces atroroseus]|uniref:ABC multidrug transporter MDR2 n=1 Tax=Talaromyces atroroseus TaxID=1441469 RepID=A0A225AES1_TALAT|nr:hypothetical protein UA08_08266 [Talaromyces atroroseus]OKL56524.1 hypothetical protein UA08_08266 [Talaromyces atroroseus]
MTDSFDSGVSPERPPSLESTARESNHDENGDSKTTLLRTSWRSLFRFTTLLHLPALLTAILLTLAAGVIRVVFALYLGKLFQILSQFGNGAITGTQLLEQARAKVFIFLILGGLTWLLSSCFLLCWIVFAELQSRQLRELQIATAQPLGFFLLHAVRIISAVILAFIISWRVTLVTMAGIPVSFVVITFTSARMAPIMKAQQSELSEASKLTYDAFKSIDIVKCLNGQASTYAQMTARIRSAARYYMKLAVLLSVQVAVPRFMSFLMFVQGFWYGSTLVQVGELTPGDVLTTFWACLIVTQSVSQIVHQSAALERGKIAGEKLIEYVHVPDMDISRTRIQSDRYPDLQTEDIVLKDVTFAYPPRLDRPVLKSLNVSFSAGRTTFIVGRSGAGKSTLINLLLQFYSPTSGGILVGDTPFQAIDTSWVRHNITFVQQNSYLFNETLWDNIAFGCRNPRSVSSDQMEMCIEMANLQETVNNLPNGLETNVGLRGNLLSGGQKQRAAISRARMKNSAVLILDEFTSALDFDNRSTVMEAVRKWREGMTTIIITHDTSNILDDDFVYVLEEGKVAASGLKKDLVKGDQRLDFAEATSPNNLLSSHGLLDDDSIIQSEQSGNSLGEMWLASFEGSEGKTGITVAALVGKKNTSSLHEHEEIFSSPSSQSSPETQKPPAAARRKSGAAHVRFPSVNSNELVHSLYKSQTTNTTTNRAMSESRGQNRRYTGESSQSEKADILPTTLPVHKTLLTIPSILNLRQKILLTTAMVLATLHACVTPIFSYLLSRLFDSFYTADQSKASSVARTFSISIVTLAVVDGLMTFVMHYLFEYCSQTWMDELRSRSMHRILAQPCSWFERKEHSPLQLTICLDQHAEEIRNLAGRFGSSLVISIITAVVAIVWSFSLKWQLTTVSLACAPVWYGVSKGLEIVNKRWERLTNDVNEEISDVFSEAFTDVQTVKAFTLENHFRSKLSIMLRRGLAVGFKRGFYSGIFYGLAESVIIFASALLIYYAAVLAAPKAESISSIMSVLTMILFSLGYAVSVMSWIPQVNSANDTATRLIKLSQVPYGSFSHEDSGKLRVFEPVPIEFHNLHFHYPSRPEARVLRDFSLKIPENSCTAIIGSSGSGKSTIIALLLGLYACPDPAPGEDVTIAPLTLGGVDIRQVHMPTLRSLIGYVPQQPKLFADTIRANITYGLDAYSRFNSIKNVEAAAAAAGIADFIHSLPEGYSTLVGEGGLSLSGGQAQRLVIARALVRHPRILILDEPTSNLDAESAEIIRRSVKRLLAARQGLTVLLVTHSQDMMEIADNVVVIDRGAAVEQGPYLNMWNRVHGSGLREMLDMDVTT